ncbi:hypothetical protein RC62_3696 [Flavobacterium aquidurense]|uniref:Uncharacterized protein n=1 Tax=Flavobacterium aquidurense TaxID=362413 RepID=A0A0Q0SCF1_9FLAO|nr:hypothetical protein RC62_3696 [Flavobacterium aquidurense]
MSMPFLYLKSSTISYTFYNLSFSKTLKKLKILTFTPWSTKLCCATKRL